MKKTILAAILGLGSLAFANNAQAQSFKFTKDTIVAFITPMDTYPANYNDVTNLSSSDVTYTWKVVSHNLPSDWQAAYGICDNNQCYGSTILSGTSSQTSLTVKASKTMDFHSTMDLTNATTMGGTYYVTVEMKEGSTTKNATFQYNRVPTSVGTVAKGSDNVILYPNPVRGELNVIFDANAGIKTVSIYNIIGKALSVYKVSGNSAKLDVDDLPSGIYFIRLSDSQGRIVTTRKFTHQ